MSRRRSRSSSRSHGGTIQTLRHRIFGTLRDLAVGLTLISVVSYLPGSITEDWSSQAQRAVAIARDIRVLAGDVAWDAAIGTGRLLAELAAVLVSLRPSLPAFPVPAPPQASVPAPPPTRQEPAPPVVPVPTPAAPPTDAGPVAETLPKVPGSFSAAKRLLYDRVYAGHRVTFYCGCDYDQTRQTELIGCGLGAFIGEARAQRVEADHIFPAAQFGQSRPCWRTPTAFPDCTANGSGHLSGRACCEKVDPTFATAHNDLQNLVPAVGLVNGKRSDYNWGMVSGGERFGDCAIRVDASIRRVDPPAAVRGDIARIMLYMSDTYGFRLSRQDTQLYVAWNNEDPPDAWEIERDRRIAEIQGRGNRYVEDYRRL